MIDTSFILISAICLDWLLGEPKKYHPLVYFGALATQVEGLFLKTCQSPFSQKLSGLLAMLIIVLPLMTLLIFVQSQYPLSPWLSIALLYLCIAPNSLAQHATAVYEALNINDMASAKSNVALIVSRETQKMSAIDIRRATIESVLENGLDAIFAPIFWFVFFGIEWTLLHRLVNTLDAMWGYKNSRYLYFGRSVAKLDDLLNWLPARLTALGYALCGHTLLAFKCWWHQGHQLESPNGGPVMTCGAGALNLKLGGSAYYHGQLKHKIFYGGLQAPRNQDIVNTLVFIQHNLIVWILSIAFIEIVGDSIA